MSHIIDTELAFLARSTLYDTVKPYSLRFEPPDGTLRTNLVIEKRQLKIRDARQYQPTIEQHGFTITSIPTQLTYSSFSDPAMIEKFYVKELEAHLKELFHVPHARVIDYAVRRRHPTFPVSTGAEYTNQQPAALVHIDFSHNEGINMLNTLYGDQASKILQYRWLIINAWRPLKGPLFDWPLAVCDSRTFNQVRDAQISDAVYPAWAYENTLIHFHEEQAWYYFSQMKESETLLFKCTDSDETAAGPCPHGSFPNRLAPRDSEPRESIESRVFLMWSPIEKLPAEVGTLYEKRRES